MHYHKGTDVGRVRKHNEDTVDVIQLHNHALLAVVCDGMGGHRAGDVASRLAVEELKALLQKETLPEELDLCTEVLKQAVYSVNERLNEYQRTHPECAGMGTTMTAVVVTDSGISSVNVGDSRLYEWTPEALVQLTNDQSLVGELLRRGEISEVEAAHHPRKNVLLQALGTESSVNVDAASFPGKTGGLLLLCSDGLTNKLSDSDLHEIIGQKHLPLSERINMCIDEANNRGGEDNITLILIDDTDGGNSS
ncbi:Stp1/IreP family PP2C-type Ser/Thr phosphatase [Alkalicoccus urumqiensis]|nr:Stp1/IreP family PP2C-type Ser/Thr phosphatase [Alkalicoccus urumqiensis]